MIKQQRESDAWLKLDARKTVVFDFCSDCHPEPVGKQSDIVLQETAVKSRRKVRRQECQGRRVLDVVIRIPESQSPDKAMTWRRRQAMLKIEIIGVQVFSKSSGDIPMCLVEILLDLYFR